MEGISSKSFFSLLFFFCFLFGLYSYLKSHVKNSCKMTYMFEYPEYVKLPLTYEITNRYPRYNLYLYGEGRYAEDLRQKKIKGIPVLFLNGNAGSYRQARSLASVALRVGETIRSSFHFNIFTVDFREELSGLYGGVLEDEASFVFECINFIKGLYVGATHNPKQVIIIGHSMGGVVARAVLSNPKLNPESIALLLTLATPHKEPVIPFDKALIDFYAKTEKAWGQNNELKHIPIMSIAGGERDIVVRSALTFLKEAENKRSHMINVLTTAIPGVWMSNDHLAITWCKQMMLTIVRAMFDLIDDKKVSKNLTVIQNVLEYHFIRRSQLGFYPKAPFIPLLSLSVSGEWIYEDELSWRFSKNKVLSTHYIMIPLVKDEYVVLIASGLLKADWIFACHVMSENGTKTCSDAVNLSDLGKIIPQGSSLLEQKMINIDSSNKLKDGFSHLIVFIAASNSQVEVLGERYKSAEREKHFVLPSVYERLVFYSPVRIQNFPLTDKAIFHNLSFTGLSSLVEASTITFETRICRAGNNAGQGVVRARNLWSNEEEYHPIKASFGSLTNIPIKSHFLPYIGSDPTVQLEIIFNPECSYVLFISSSLTNILSQFVKFYGLYIPSYGVPLYLYMISGQLYSKNGFRGGSSHISCEILIQFPAVVSLVFIPCFLHHVIRTAGFAPAFIPLPDNILYDDCSLYFSILYRAVLYITASGLVFTVSLVFEKFFVGMAHIWIWIRRKSIHEVTRNSLAESTRNFNIDIYSLLMCAMLESVAICFAGSVSLVLGYFVYFYKVLKVCIKCKAEEQRRGRNAATSKWHFYFILSFLWLLAILLTFPAFLTWINQLPFSIRLTTDPHTWPCIMLLLATAIILQLPVPVHSQLYTSEKRIASYVLLLLAVLSSAYAIKSIYRLVYFISFAFVIIGIQQMFSFCKEKLQRKVD